MTEIETKRAVSDFATDWDHTDPQWVNDPYPIWEDLRERCPIAHTDRYGGGWFPTTHEMVSSIANDTQHFTSHQVVVIHTKNPENAPPAPMGGAPPITSDPPFHRFARRLILPAFAPGPVRALESQVRALCGKHLDALGDTKEFDAATSYAQFISPGVIAKMLGFPESDEDLFREFVHLVLDLVDLEPAVRAPMFLPMADYFNAQIDDHVANPREDFDFYGCPMKKDDWILLGFPAANRDPAAFVDADKFIVDRAVNRHAAFGLGIHRCVGSNLARMELRVAIEEFIARYPKFELSDPRAVTWAQGQVRGPRTIPLRVLA